MGNAILAKDDLRNAYQAMAADKTCECEAEEWVNSLIGDAEKAECAGYDATLDRVQ